MGPLLSGFAVQEKGLQWTIWPLLCGTGLTWIMVFFLMPETSGNAILTKRASTLRRITGNDGIRSHAQSSSAYVTGWVVCAIALILYCAYNQKVVLPWFKSGKWKPEYRTQARFVGGILFPISLFWVCYQ